MALIVSAATGNFNAGATWVGGVVPTIGDEARSSNGHTITISASATCDEISNAGTGIFALSDGVTLRANITNKTTTHSRSCLQFAAATGFIEGNCTGGPTLACVGVINTGSGTLYITGNCVGGSGGSGGINIGSRAVSNDSTGAVVITGNCTGGSGGSSTHSHGAQNSSTGSLAITGNVTGGALSSNGVYNHVNGTVTITGTCTGGTSTTASGLLNASTGTVTITGRAIGGTSVSAGIGVQNSSTGNVFLTRAAGNGFGPGSTGLSAAVGLANAGLGLVEIQQLEYGSNGMSPTSGTGIRLKKLGSNVAVFNFCDTVGAKTLIDATQNAAMPAATDVRSGVSYASGALTGTCAVPSPATVATGVPVDNTFGTAALSASDVATAVWAAATRTITGGLVDTATTLTNAPTVPSVVQIRQEMDSNSTKLANLDATVSSRLAPSGTLATVTTLTNAPTSVTPSDIWSHATRTITGGTVDTLTNAPTVPSVVQIRQEMDSNSTQLAAIKAKTDALPASPAAVSDIPSANISAIKAKTDLLVTDRLAQCSTVATTGAQLAAALS